MDAFFASVEQRDEPSLRGKPVVVGGSPEQRGVVAAASYEAREFGIHSAMPSRTAKQRCPHLIFVRPRFDVYREVSDQIHEIFHEYTDLVEPLSLDEAYLDVTINKREMPSATLLAREIKQRIFETTQLTASAGVSINKFLAKAASAIRKPNGLFLITPEHAEAFVEQFPVEKFYGIGPATAEKMHALGIHTGLDLKGWSEIDLVNKFGKTGRFYYMIARAHDERPVDPNRIRKSLGAEESFAEDLKDRYSMIVALEEIAKTLKRRIDSNEANAKTLTLKVKYADYQQVTRSKTLPTAVREMDEIMKHALELLDTTEAEKKRVRLLGLAVSKFDSESEEPSDYVQLKIPLFQE